jgi:hypothetical protein
VSRSDRANATFRQRVDSACVLLFVIAAVARQSLVTVRPLCSCRQCSCTNQCSAYAGRSAGSRGTWVIEGARATRRTLGRVMGHAAEPLPLCQGQIYRDLG